MPIPVNFFTLTRNGVVYAFKPEDISFGDDQTLEVKLNRDGDINVAPLAKKSVSLTLQGAAEADLVTWQAERDNNIIDMIAGNLATSDLVFGAYTIYSAWLRSLTPSAPMTVNNVTLYDTIELEFVSQVYV